MLYAGNLLNICGKPIHKLVFCPVIVGVLLILPTVSVCQEVHSGAGTSGGFGPFIQHSASSPSLQLSAATAFRAHESPGYLIASKKPIGTGESSVAYLFAVDHNYAGDESDEFPFRVEVTDGDGQIRQGVQLGTRQLIIEYKVSVPHGRTGLCGESLTVNDTPIDLDSGRVFSINLRRGNPELQQLSYQFVKEELRGKTEALDVAKAVWKHAVQQIRSREISPTIIDISSTDRQ